MIQSSSYQIVPGDSPFWIAALHHRNFSPDYGTQTGYSTVFRRTKDEKVDFDLSRSEALLKFHSRQQKISQTTVNAFLADYDAFYRNLRKELQAVQEQHGCFVMLNVQQLQSQHSVEAENKVVVSTANVKSSIWHQLVDKLRDALEDRVAVSLVNNWPNSHFADWVRGYYPDMSATITLYFPTNWTQDEIGETLAGLFPTLQKEQRRIYREIFQPVKMAG